MKARWLFLFGFTGALLTGVGCSDSGGGVVAPPPALACTDGGPAGTNSVILNCAAAVNSTTELVSVVIGGAGAFPTTLRGLNFDVTYDPAKVEFVPAASYSSPLFPNGLIVVGLANGNQGRLVVSIQQPGDEPAVNVFPGEHDVLNLTFRRTAAATFGSTPLAFENSEATTPSAAITFVNGLALSYQ